MQELTTSKFSTLFCAIGPPCLVAQIGPRVVEPHPQTEPCPLRPAYVTAQGNLTRLSLALQVRVKPITRGRLWKGGRPLGGCNRGGGWGRWEGNTREGFRGVGST